MNFSQFLSSFIQEIKEFHSSRFLEIICGNLGNLNIHGKFCLMPSHFSVDFIVETDTVCSVFFQKSCFSIVISGILDPAIFGTDGHREIESMSVELHNFIFGGVYDN